MKCLQDSPLEPGRCFTQNAAQIHSSFRLWRNMMSIERAEKLKRELTDKWVTVAKDVPELRRFSNRTGKVRTVNMNCRALVEFDGPEDISWYDIDPDCLKVVDGPKPKAKAKVAPKKEKAAAKPATAKPAAQTGGGSPLDAIRGGAKPASASAGSKSASPLDAIRASGAAPKASGASPLDAIRAQGKTTEPKSETGGSPLDKIRASASGTKSTTEEAASQPAAETADTATAADTAAAESATDTGGAVKLPPGTSAIDLIRAQAAAEKND